MGQLFFLFLFIFVLFNTNFTEKTVDVSRIRTQIGRVEGEHADHLTTTTTAHVDRKNVCHQHFLSGKDSFQSLEWVVAAFFMSLVKSPLIIFAMDKIGKSRDQSTT